MNSTTDILSALFAGIFAFVQAKLRGRVAPEEIARVARAVLNQMQVEAGPVTWADATPLTVGNARWIEHVRRPVRVVGHVAELQDPYVAAVPTPDGGVEHKEMTAAKIVGIDGEQLRLLDVVDRPLIEKIQAAYKTGRLHEVLGIVVVVPDVVKVDVVGAAGRFYFVPVDIRSTGCAFDLLGATQQERDDARSHLSDLRASGRVPLQYIFEELTTNLGVVALEDAPHLVDALEAVILQALSTGTVGSSPARIHILLIGPPGVGKKIVGLCARVLNPVCEEASAAKMSAAGLVGASYQTADGWRSTPGLLPLAAEGALVLQDAHGLKGAKLDQIAPILQELLEDGVVRDSVAGGRKRVATTATLIDLNRTAHVQVGSIASGKEAAILGVLPLLSREDVILEVPVSPQRAWAVGERMYRGLHQGGGPLDEQPWVRRLRLLVALLRNEHPVIDTSAVDALMEQAHRDVRDENADFNDVSPTEASAIPVRMAVTFKRLVIASARAQDRGHATPQDVEGALRYVRMKINFLRRAAKLAGVPVSECPSGRRAADEGFWGRRAGAEVSASDLRDEYKRETGSTVSVKTITRELRRRKAANVILGRWRLPPTSGHGK